MALSATEEYIESSYFADADYVGGVADAVGILGGYFAEGADYVETGYLLDQTVQFTIVINTDGVVQEASATLASAVSFSATVSRIRPADVTLNNIANLNAQAAITRATDSSLSCAFAMGHNGDGFQPNVEPSVEFSGSSTLSSNSTLTTDALIVKFGDSTQNSTTSLTSTPIEYRSKWVDTNRPISWSVVRWDSNSETWISDSNYAFDATTKKYGTHSLHLFEHTGFTHRSAKTEPLGLSSADRGKDWAIDFWFNTDYIDSDNNAILSISSNAQNNPLPGYQEDPSSATSLFNLVVYHDSGTLYLRAKNNSGTFVLGSSSASYDISANTWYHIQVIYDESASTLTLKRGTNTVATLLGDYDNYWNANSAVYLHNPQQSYNSAGSVGSNFYFDELHFRVGNNSIDSSGYTYGTEDTAVLAHFDNNFDDDLGVELSGEATVDSTVSASATLNGTVNGSAVLDTNAGFAITAVATKVGETVLPIVASTTASGDRVRFADSTQNSAIGIAIDAQRIRSAEAVLSGAGGFAVAANLTRAADAELSSAFAFTATGTTNKLGDGVLSTVISVSSSGDRIRSVDSTQNTTISINAIPTVTRSTTATFNTDAGFAITAVATRVGEVALDVAVGITTDLDRIRTVDSTLPVIATATSEPTKISPIRTTANSEFALSSTASVTRDSDAALPVIASITPLTGVVYQGSATLPGFAAVISVNKVLHIDQYVYVIPSENRTYSIPAETRSYSIVAENRTYEIEGS